MLLFTHIFLNFHSNSGCEAKDRIQEHTTIHWKLNWAIKYLTFIITCIILFIQSFLHSYLIKRYELLYETIVDVFLERHWSGKEKRKNIWLLCKRSVSCVKYWTPSSTVCEQLYILHFFLYISIKAISILRLTMFQKISIF